jgi:hypothetical protein
VGPRAATRTEQPLPVLDLLRGSAQRGRRARLHPRPAGRCWCGELRCVLIRTSECRTSDCVRTNHVRQHSHVLRRVFQLRGIHTSQAEPTTRLLAVARLSRLARLRGESGLAEPAAAGSSAGRRGVGRRASASCSDRFDASRIGVPVGTTRDANTVVGLQPPRVQAYARARQPHAGGT